MTLKPQVRVESDLPSNTHWFKRSFFKKDGYKSVVRWSRVTKVAVVGAVALSALSVWRPGSQKKPVPLLPSQPKSTPPSDSLPLEEERTIPQPKTRKRPIERWRGPALILRPAVPIPPGSVVKSVLLDAATEGPVRAKTLESLHILGEEAISQGALLLGSATSAEDRIHISFHHLMGKDGGTIPFHGTAMDLTDQWVGLPAESLESKALELAGALGLHFLGAASLGLQETDVKGGVAFHKNTLPNALLNGASQVSLEEARSLAEGLKSKKPRLKVHAGKEFLLVVTE